MCIGFMLAAMEKVRYTEQVESNARSTDYTDNRMRIPSAFCIYTNMQRRRTSFMAWRSRWAMHVGLVTLCTSSDHSKPHHALPSRPLICPCPIMNGKYPRPRVHDVLINTFTKSHPRSTSIDAPVIIYISHCIGLESIQLSGTPQYPHCIIFLQS